MKASLDGIGFLREVIPAISMRERMIGLLGRDGLEKGTGMLIHSCSSIHTCFMKFDLDLIFLDRSDRVVRVVESVPASRMVFGGFGASKVLEMSTGSVSLKNVQVGSQLQFDD